MHALDSLDKVTSVIIELSAKCNLSCLYCNNSALTTKTSMTYDQAVEYFHKMPDHVRKYVFHFSGESFLNRDIGRIIKFLAEKNRFMSVCTNGMVATHIYVEALSNGLNELIFSIDGFNDHTHESYRHGSNLSLIKKNLETAIAHRPAGATVGVQYLVTKHNEGEIGDMKKYLEDIGADFFYLKSLSLNLGANQELEGKKYDNAKNMLPADEKYSRYTIVGDKIALKCPMETCHLMYEPVITANGDMAMRCVDFEKSLEIGNLSDYATFTDLWVTDRYTRARSLARKKALESCKRCNFTAMGVIYEIGEPNGRTGEYVIHL